MSRPEDFGKDQGLVHQVVVKGRRLGLGREWWKQLASKHHLRSVAEYFSTEVVCEAEVQMGKTFPYLVRAGDYSFVSHEVASVHGQEKWRTLPGKPYTTQFSLYRYFRHSENGPCSRDNVCSRMAHWGLRPANLVEFLSFVIYWAELRRKWFVGRDFSIPSFGVESGVETYIIALDAKPYLPSSRSGECLGMKISGDNLSRAMFDLHVLSPQQEGLTVEMGGSSQTKFLAVPA